MRVRQALLQQAGAPGPAADALASGMVGVLGYQGLA